MADFERFCKSRIYSQGYASPSNLKKAKVPYTSSFVASLYVDQKEAMDLCMRYGNKLYYAPSEPWKVILLASGQPKSKPPLGGGCLPDLSCHLLPINQDDIWSQTCPLKFWNTF